MRFLGSLVLVAASASSVFAQPAPDPAPPPPASPPPQQYPQQGYGPPQGSGGWPAGPGPQQGSGGWPAGAGAPPQQYPQQGYGPQYGAQYGQPQPMPVQLTVDEQYLLERGFISEGQHIGGGVAALFLGFGSGQAVQGRWGEKGWIFTLGEGASIVLMFYGFAKAIDCNGSYSNDVYYDNCEDDYIGLMVGSLLAFSVFRVWETIDAFTAPTAHNRKVRQLRARLGLPVPMYTKMTPYLAPVRGGDGGGVAGISFKF